MKVIYEFDLDKEDSDNRTDLLLHQNAMKMYLALHDIDDHCRDVWKYGKEMNQDWLDKLLQFISESNIHEV